MEVNPLIPVGTKIKVDKSKIENIIPNKKLDDLPQIIIGEIIDYKMTDGMGIGYVLTTENKIKIWVFSNELNKQTKIEFEINDTTETTSIIPSQLISGINKVKYDINGNRNIKTILNPMNLIGWLIFSIKDIF